jgi:hypothetical protein
MTEGALIEVADFRTESRARPPPLARAPVVLCPNHVHPPRIPGTDGRKVLKGMMVGRATHWQPGHLRYKLVPNFTEARVNQFLGFRSQMSHLPTISDTRAPTILGTRLLPGAKLDDIGV